MLFNEVSKSLKAIDFFCPTRGTRIFESQVAKFLELDMAESFSSKSPESLKPSNFVFMPMSIVSDDVVQTSVNQGTNLEEGYSYC